MSKWVGGLVEFAPKHQRAMQRRLLTFDCWLCTDRHEPPMQRNAIQFELSTNERSACCMYAVCLFIFLSFILFNVCALECCYNSVMPSCHCVSLQRRFVTHEHSGGLENGRERCVVVFDVGCVGQRIWIHECSNFTLECV